jgi:WD40 repeat protein
LLAWDLNQRGAPARSISLDLNSSNEVLGVAMDPAGTEVAVHLRWQSGISRFDPWMGRLIGQWTTSVGGNPGEPAMFAPASGPLLALFSTGGFRMWERQDSSKARPGGVSGTDIRSAAFSPDGRTIALACEDHSIRILDSGTLGELGVLRGHQHAVVDVSFSSDGRSLASCSVVGEVKLWSWPARREAATVVSQGPYSYVRFSPDGKRIVVGGWGRAMVETVPTLEAATPLR